VYGGLQHDLTVTIRGASLFDQAGEHEPTHAGPWPLNEIDLLDDQTLVELADVLRSIDDAGKDSTGIVECPMLTRRAVAPG